jgi:hypothetical protein
MTTRQEAIDNARHVATEAMQAKGEVESMIIGHTAGRPSGIPLGRHDALSKDQRCCGRDDRGEDAHV